MPWAVVVLSLFFCGLVAWEGFICIVMMTPVALVLAAIGGLVAGGTLTPEQPRVANVTTTIMMLLPFLFGSVEHRLPARTETRSVSSEVTIQAPMETAWRNIERVPLIDEHELPRSWTRVIGFPRPLEATLSYEGTGGVRHATFAGNVLFLETIDVWQPMQRLGFSIRTDPDSIPTTTLDEHVTVGGKYFDVLHGEYVLEPLSEGQGVRLRLISRHRVSTDFNWYARLWTDAVMQDVQRSILYVIKNRCENSHGN
jgi:hypothetical protein